MHFSVRLWAGVLVLLASTGGVLSLLADNHAEARATLLEMYATQQQDQAALASRQLEVIKQQIRDDISRLLWQETWEEPLSSRLSAASGSAAVTLVSMPGAVPGPMRAVVDRALLRSERSLPVVLPIGEGQAIQTSLSMVWLSELLGTTRQGSDVWLATRDGTLLASANHKWIGADLVASAGACGEAFSALLDAERGTLSYCWPDSSQSTPATTERIAGFEGVTFFGLEAVVGVSAESAVLSVPLATSERTTRQIALLATGSTLLLLLLGSLELRAQRRRERTDALNTLGALNSALEARDPYTCFHSENVSVYAQELARRMGLSAREQEQVRIAGLMHDIGKIGICDAVLNKPGRLTPEERAEIERHAELGEHILCHLSWAGDLAAAVGAHHERMDGTGYPRGLCGEEIPLHARIVAVADVFDALITDRPYRAGMPLPKVVQIITEMSGEHLDPEIVTVLLDDPASLLSMGRGVRMEPQPSEAPADHARSRLVGSA